MQVLFDKVAIISQGRPERQGALYLAPSAEEAMVISGIVNAAGPLADEFVKEGDVVWFNKHNAFTANINGVEYRIISVKELLAVEPSKKIPVLEVLKETAAFTAPPNPVVVARHKMIDEALKTVEPLSDEEAAIEDPEIAKYMDDGGFISK